jgi:hypothetical protein
VATKAVTAIDIVHIVSIGVGGLSPPPAVKKVTARISAPTATMMSSGKRTLAGCGREAAKSGSLAPQATQLTVSIGRAERRQKQTHTRNTAVVNIWVTPIEIMMMTADARIPKKG